jgi:coenzyme F420 hydrogenase subunit beta
LRLLGLAAPRFVNMPTLRYWLGLPLQQKLQSTIGTAKRARRKHLRRPADLTPYLPPALDSDEPTLTEGG